MADLLSREGHPLAARVVAARDRHDPRDLVEPSFAPRRAFGIAAGTALVFGAVVAGALGLSHPPSTTPTAAGEPVGALPSKGAPVAKPAQAGPAAPEAPAAQPVQQPFVNTAATERAAQPPSGRAGEIGVPASVRPPQAPKPPRSNPPAQQPNQQQPAAPAAQAPAPGPVQSLAAPVTQTVGGGTLTHTVAPVTSTLDNTLQPALSLIGGLLGG